MLRIKNVLISTSNLSHSFSECLLGYKRKEYEDENFCYPCPYPFFGGKCLKRCNCSTQQRYDTNIITQLLVPNEDYFKKASCAH